MADELHIEPALRLLALAQAQETTSTHCMDQEVAASSAPVYFL